jgi:ferredoxin
MGSGLCIVYAPATFAHDDETKAVVIDPAGDAVESLFTAIEARPTGALTVRTKAEGG